MLDKVTAYGLTNGAYLNNYYWNGTTYVNVGGITVTNSKFSLNGYPAGSNTYGLCAFSKGAILINGVTSNGNNGNGLYLGAYGTSVTIKNSTFSNNYADVDADDRGIGIFVNDYATANITLDNVYLSNNENRGAIINTTGNVILKKVTVYGNGDEGIIITKNNSAFDVGARNVTVTDSTFYRNGKTNLEIYASGSVIITNLVSTGSIGGSGLAINNVYAPTSLPVTLTNATLTGNSIVGGNISTKGTITVSGIIASNNSSLGLYLDNGLAIATGSVVMLGTLGTNKINNNGVGLMIYSQRNISLTSLQANGNSDIGINLMGGGPSSNVILTGVESSYNLDDGISIMANGIVTISKVTANKNGNTALFIANDTATTAKSVLVTNSTFNDNVAPGAIGLYIVSVGSITVNNVEASGNTEGGARLQNGNISLLTQIPQGIVVTKSTFNNTISGRGLVIESLRKITLSNINASGNGDDGVSALNLGSTVNSPIVVTGVNRMSNNAAIGIGLYSNGTVTASGLVTIANSTRGIEILSLGLVTLTNSQAVDNQYRGISIESNGNTIISGVQTIQNGAGVDGQGIYLTLSAGRLYISNSIIMANSGLGLYADVVNPSTDVVIASTTLIMGNDAGEPYDDGEYLIE